MFSKFAIPNSSAKFSILFIILVLLLLAGCTRPGSLTSIDVSASADKTFGEIPLVVEFTGVVDGQFIGELEKTWTIGGEFQTAETDT